MSGNIVVAVRCRPLNSREIGQGKTALIRMDGNQTILDPPIGTADNHASKQHAFSFDHSYWSAGPKHEPGYASQQTLFDDLGIALLDHAFEGYNTCIFAYGQTGSGKSYTMMGYGADRGIIPLTCCELFERITQRTTDVLTYNVEVSFIEIYNERVRDLLNPKNRANLKVREHPSLGPYVEDLSKLAVESFEGIEQLMDEGNKARTVAATNMNETSSRSHSVFTLLLTQKRQDAETGVVGEKVSRISLIDLAGSERANSTGATGQRLKEGANINKSLTTLGKVIAALASASSASPVKGRRPKDDFIPYRDSVLTWLLKDSLGGNSKTAMIAAISPTDYSETLSTLRYADQAKKIKNKAVINEDANAKMVRELKEELAILRARVSGNSMEASYDPSVPPEKQIVTYKSKSGEIKTVTKAELQDQLEASEKIMADLQQSWEQKMAKTQEIQVQREAALEELGITIERGNIGVRAPAKMPHLVNLCEDPLMNECLVYQIKPGRTTVGTVNADPLPDIRLSGSSILPIHCYFQNDSDGIVMLHAMPESTTMVNGLRIGSEKPRRLKSGYRIIFGSSVFRFNHPEEVREARAREKEPQTPDTLHSPFEKEGRLSHTTAVGYQRPPTPTESEAQGADWTYARREAIMAKFGNTDVDLEQLEDSDLDRLFNDLVKVRTSRKRPESRISMFGTGSLLSSSMEDEDESSGDSASRPFSGATWTSSSTEDTSLDSTLRLDSTTDARISEAKEEMQREMDAQREEYETKLESFAASIQAVEDTRKAQLEMESKLHQMHEIMQQKLEEQKHHYEQEVRKLASQSSLSPSPRASTAFNEKEVHLALGVISRWKALGKVRLAHRLLSNAVLVKEANVISKELHTNVVYQFCLISAIGAPRSAIDLVGNEDKSGDDSYDVSPSKRSSLGVMIFDKANSDISIWSWSVFESRLPHMRRLQSLSKRISIAVQIQDTFCTRPARTFSFVGYTQVPLNSLLVGQSILSHFNIFCHYTAQPIAQCTVRIRPTSSLASEGSFLHFEFQADSIRGLAADWFTNIHFQLSSSFITGSTNNSDLHTSTPSTVDQEGTSRTRLRKSFSVKATAETLQLIRANSAILELHAEVRSAWIERLEAWDCTREATHHHFLPSPLPDIKAKLLFEQQYDVNASIQVLELATSGQYSPVRYSSSDNNANQGVFVCHLGLQKKLQLRLSHNAGNGWCWSKIRDIHVGNIKHLDKLGLDQSIIDTAPTVPLHISGKPRVDALSDGTNHLTFSAVWDSSAHDDDHLNRLSKAGEKIQLTLSFTCLAENAPPTTFHLDFAVRMKPRDAGEPSKISQLFSSVKSSRAAHYLFDVRFKPAASNSTSELWRADTSVAPVPGESILNSWRPRGITLIKDHEQLLRRVKHQASLNAIKTLLASTPISSCPALPTGIEAQHKLAGIIALWQRQIGTRKEIELSQRPPVADALQLLPNSGTHPRRSKSVDMEASAKIVTPTSAIDKSGHLQRLVDSQQNTWSRSWVVLKRPYLLHYASTKENDLHLVINIDCARIERAAELEDAIGRKFVLAIYTVNNAYFYQAESEAGLHAWCNVLDSARLPEST